MDKLTYRVIIGISATILLMTWVITLSAKTVEEKQIELINRATALINDGIYISAVPLLEEAAGYNTAYTRLAEDELKKVYLTLIDNRGFKRKYIDILNRQMAADNAGYEIFLEVADYYIRTNAYQEAFETLRTGIERTNSEELADMYESIRYMYELNRAVYEDVSAVYNYTLQVMREGKWGVVDINGRVIIPCIYDKVSTFSQNRVIVREENEIYAVNSDNNRIAVAPTGALDFRNLADNRTAFLLGGGWNRASGDLQLGTSTFEDIGMYSGGYVAAKSNGRWGVIDIGNKWLVEPLYDEIIQDELGRCYGQQCVFVRSGDTVYLFSRDTLYEEAYQDAKPFSDEGYAAVCKNGKWGFIDTEGNLVVDYIFDEALSFTGHIAAVKIGEFWGYINTRGQVVIDTVFYDVRSFSGGSAPVLTDKGWQIITLVEYRKERRLI